MSTWQCPKCFALMKHHDQNPRTRTVFSDPRRLPSSSVWCVVCDRAMVCIDELLGGVAAIAEEKDK